MIKIDGAMGSDSEESVNSSAPMTQKPELNSKGVAIRSSEKPKGVCFGCKQMGHWSKDCPNKGALSFPVVLCPCGKGPCIVMTSKTERNPGRNFFKCPADVKCNYFKWCDELMQSPDKQQFKGKSPVRSYGQNPTCECGAGECVIRTMADGPDAGREYYGCPIKKGQGACIYKQWLDSPAKPSKPKEKFLVQSTIPSLLLPKEQKKCEVVNDTSPNNTSARGQASSNVVRWYDSPTKECKIESNCNEKPRYRLMVPDLLNSPEPMGISSAKEKNRTANRSACNPVRWFELPIKSCEMEIHPGFDQSKRFQVPEEPKKPEIDNCGAAKTMDSFTLVDVEIEEQVVTEKETNKTNCDVNSQTFTHGASITLAPLLAPKRVYEHETGDAASPPKRLNLHYDSSNKIRRGECYSCGGLGHSTQECEKMTGAINIGTPMELMFMNSTNDTVSPPVSPKKVHGISSLNAASPERVYCGPNTSGKGECYKYGRLGHWMFECPENTKTTNAVNLELLGNTALITLSPPLSPKRVHVPYRKEASKPLKELSLHDGSPNTFRPGECYNCGGLGHSTYECSINLGLPKNSASTEQTLNNAAFVVISPPVSPKSVHTAKSVASPLKRLSLSNGNQNPIKPGKCYKCYTEGHWYNECPY